MLLPDYPIDDLAKELRGLGFERFIETKDLVAFDAGPFRLRIHALVAPTDGPIGDSALLIDDGDVRVLNMNDSRPPEPDTLLEDGPLDAAFLQFSGAIWYPMVYDYPDNAQHILGHKKRVAQSARALRYIEVLDPAFVVPSAGPPCFLDDDLFEYNDIHGDAWNTFPDQPTFLAYLAEHGRDRAAGSCCRAASPRSHRVGSTSRIRWSPLRSSTTSVAIWSATRRESGRSSPMSAALAAAAGGPARPSYRHGGTPCWSRPT